MPCRAPNAHDYCPINRHYCSSGQYHGELCGGCDGWQDSPEDKAFKERLAKFYEYCRSHPPTRQARRSR